jgi:hypothetical protein
MFNDHIVNAISHHDLRSDSTLHVVAVVSNPVRFHSRYRLFRKFAEQMNATANVKLHIVELAFGDRHHEVTTAETSSCLQLRSSAELWHKENMINLGVQHLLPHDWRYVAWVDADVLFGNSNWALETLHALQHYPVVQPWSDCMDLGPYGNVMSLHRSFASLVAGGQKIQAHAGEPYTYGHSGFAWACTRAFWENTRGLIDWAVLGSADHHMAWAMLNQVDRSLHQQMPEAFKRKARDWQTLAYRETHGHIGYVPGRIEHSFHGSKRKRFYRERWDVFVRNNFDPDRDLKRDAQGLFYLVGKTQLAEDIRRYMRSRDEDGISE